MTQKNLHDHSPNTQSVNPNNNGEGDKASRIETFYSHTKTLPSGFQIHFTASRILPKGSK